MATAKVLDKDTYCACCGEPMKAGEPFRWEEKQVKSGPRVGAYRTAYRPAHVNRLCAAEKYERDQAERQAAEDIATVKFAREQGLPAADKIRDLCASKLVKYPDLAERVRSA